VYGWNKDETVILIVEVESSKKKKRKPPFHKVNESSKKDIIEWEASSDYFPFQMFVARSHPETKGM